jgi:hypothetical protein
LPPSSRCSRFTVGAAAAITSRPARTEPVSATIAGTGCCTIASPVERSPHTTFSTPSGSTSAASSASISGVTGVLGALLSTTALPAATAGAHFQVAIISG